VLRQRDVDLVIFFVMGSVIGAILLDAGLSIWLVPVVVAAVAVLLVGVNMLKLGASRKRG
jgi:uncharacterized membrane protein YcaP (DUF421 family)